MIDCSDSARIGALAIVIGALLGRCQDKTMQRYIDFCKVISLFVSASCPQKPKADKVRLR